MLYVILFYMLFVILFYMLFVILYVILLKKLEINTDFEGIRNAYVSV